MTAKQKEFYQFARKNLLQGLLGFALVIGALLLFRYFIGDKYEVWIHSAAEYPAIIYSLFFTNETVGGLIAPEIFMVLFTKNGAAFFWQNIALMALLSYVGGIVAYYFGKFLQKRFRLLSRLQKSERNRKLLHLYNKYGGWMIFLAAVTPIPFALLSLISGAVNFRFGSYLKYAGPRFLRFVVYGYFIWYV